MEELSRWLMLMCAVKVSESVYSLSSQEGKPWQDIKKLRLPLQFPHENIFFGSTIRKRTYLIVFILCTGNHATLLTKRQFLLGCEGYVP